MSRRALLHPTRIQLDELPDQGRDYTYTHESQELGQVLADLIGDRAYHINVHLKPIGNAYEITAKVETSMGLCCGRCATEFEFPLAATFREIIVVEEKRPRHSHSTRVNHTSDAIDSGPYCNYVSSEAFDLGEWLHEVIAASEPDQPRARPDCDDACPNLLSLKKMGLWQVNEATGTGSEDNPFSVLRNLQPQRNKTETK